MKNCEVTHEGTKAARMNKIILADNQAIFRAGIAKVLASEEDFRVAAQCADLERLTAFGRCISLIHCALCFPLCGRSIRI